MSATSRKLRFCNYFAYYFNPNTWIILAALQELFLVKVEKWYQKVEQNFS